MSKLARFASRLLARASSIAWSSVSTSPEVRSWLRAAIPNVNKTIVAKKQVRVVGPPVIMVRSPPQLPRFQADKVLRRCLACQDSYGVSALHGDAPASAPTATGAVVSGMRKAHGLPSSDRLQDENLYCWCVNT